MKKLTVTPALEWADQVLDTLSTDCPTMHDEWKPRRERVADIVRQAQAEVLESVLAVWKFAQQAPMDVLDAWIAEAKVVVDRIEAERQ